MRERMLEEKVLIRNLIAQEKDRKGLRRAASTAFTLTRYHASPEFAKIGEYFGECSQDFFKIPAPREKCLVAEVNSEVVGCEARTSKEVMPGLNIAVYGIFAIQHEWQNKGIGKRLIQETTKRLLEKGLGFGKVTTDTCAWPAIRTYESVGLRITKQSLTYTLHPSEASLYERGIVRRAKDDVDASAIQKIDIDSFVPYQYFIHREFPVDKYNEYLMKKTRSREHLVQIEEHLRDYLLLEKGGRITGYIRTSSSDRMTKFFSIKLVQISPEILGEELAPEFLASAVRLLADEGADIVDMNIDYLERSKIGNAASKVGFRFIYSPIDMTGKIWRRG